MLTVNLDKTHHIAVLKPDGPLSDSDFIAAAKQVDAMIDEFGKLNGIVIHAKTFPGWDSIAAMVAHLKFVRDHHKKLSRVALSTESVAAQIAEIFAVHFVAAEIKIFSYDHFAEAKQWVAEGTNAGTKADTKVGVKA